MRKFNRKIITKPLYEISSWVLVLVYIVPIYLLVTIALKTSQEFAVNKFGLPHAPTLENIVKAWNGMNMPGPFITTAIIVTVSVAGLVLIASLAAYSIARSPKKRSSNLIYIYFMFGLMINFLMIMIPIYKMMVDFQLSSSFIGIILVNIALGLAFAIIMFTGFIKSVPSSLDEAAKIDGASKTRIFFSIILPLMKPATVTIMVFNCVRVWNDLLIPLLMMGGNPTLTTALYSFQGQKYTVDWTSVFGGSLISMLPLVIIFLFLQRYFIQGMANAGLKG